MPGIDRIADFQSARFEVSGGELVERFSGDEQVCGSVILATGGKNRTCFDIPLPETLNENEAFVGWNRGNTADKFRRIGFRFFLRVFGFSGFEHSAGHEGAGKKRDDRERARKWKTI